MKSPDPTSIGNATWTSQYSRANQTVSITSSTNASPIAITSATHGLVTGDYVFIQGHTTNTNANGFWRVTVSSATVFTLDGSTGNGVGGATGSIRVVSNRVVRMAASAVDNLSGHRNVGSGEVAWTASANVTATLEQTQFRVSDNVHQIAIAAAFTTGLAARASFVSKDLSGFQQLSFAIRATAGTVPTAGQLRINLCSDTAGAVVVDSFDVPAMIATNTWHNFTVNKGSACGAAIQSVALYVMSDVGAQTIQLSNIIACKATSAADSINLRSLISKQATLSDSDSPAWWAIDGIIGADIILGHGQSRLLSATDAHGYFGTTNTVETFKRETLISPTVAIQQYLDSGTSGSPILYSGGWDSTNMSTQDGITFLDGQNGQGTGLGPSGTRAYNSFEKLGFVRFATGMTVGGSDIILTDCHFAACATGATASPTAAGNDGLYMTGCFFTGCINGFTGSKWRMEGNNTLYGNATLGFFVRQSGTLRCFNSVISVMSADDITMTGDVKLWLPRAINGLAITSTDDFTFSNVTISGPGSSSNTIGATVAAGDGIINGSISGCTTAVSISQGELASRSLTTSDVTTLFSSTQQQRGQAYIQSLNGGNPTVHGDGFTCERVPTMNGPNTQGAWNCIITARRSVGDPIIIPICRMPVVANKLCTATLWIDTNGATQWAGLTVLGGQVAGVQDTITQVSNSTTWAQVTLTFTPTEAGVVEISMICYGVTTANIVLDEFGFSQADQSWSIVANKMDRLQQGRIYIGPEAITSGGGGGASVRMVNVRGGADQ